MTTAIRRRRGTTTQHSTFTGLEGEVTVDTTKDTLVVHDGSTAGGHPLAKENNATLAGNVTLSGGTANGVAYLNGSKVVTTGSALVFDGTNLKVGAPSFAPNTNLAGNLLQLKSASGFAYLTMGNGDGANNTGYIGSASGLLTFGSVTDAGVTSEQMRLTSTGLGIGTSSPGVKLDTVGVMRSTFNSLSNGGPTSHGLVLRQSTTDTKALVAGYSTSGNQTGAYIQAVNFGTAYEDLVIQPQGGNLGLGVTPSTSNAGKTFELNYLGNQMRCGGVNDMNVESNTYYNSGFKYASNGTATRYAQSNGAHQWHIAASGTAGNAITFTQAMTLDASGNLGIGTTSPSARLEVSDTTSAAATALVQLTGQNNYELNIQSLTTTNSTVGARYNFAVNSSNGEFSWSNSGGERARIDSSGNLLVGTTTVIRAGKISVSFADASSRGIVTKTDVTTTSAALLFTNPNGDVGNITTNGSATAYNTSSDYRLKHDIAPMTGALAKVSALKPVTYKWNADNSDGEGFIAHELAEVVPQCVTGEKDAVDEDGNPVYQGIDTSFLVATLTAAIQELKAEFDAYKATHP